MSRILRAACFVVVTLLAANPVAGNHVQSDSGRIVVFDHLGGNAWWVEVALSGQDGGQVASLEVAPYPASATMWKAMTWNAQWGKWTASVQVPPGDPVKFRATWTGGAVQSSCWFSHPAGVEACGGPGPTPTPLDATFAAVRGNAWWVQAQVKANEGHTVERVEVQVGADWRPLAKQSWGTAMYGASYPLPQGSVVRLRAFDAGGQSDASSCYRWIPAPDTDAAPVACGGTPPASVWNAKVVQAQRDSMPGDISIGDADRDGKPGTYVTGDDGLYRITASGVTAISTRTGWLRVAVGDGDEDGKAEVYATRWKEDFSGSELHRLSFGGTTWNDQIIFNDPGHLLNSLTLGDVDVFGGRDVFVGREDGGSAQVLQSRWTGTQWLTQVVLNLGDDGSFLDVWGLWVANLDGDNNLELAVLTGGRGYANAWVVDHGPPAPNVPSQWRTTRLEVHAAYPAGMTVGDLDGDGRNELALGDSSSGLVLFRHTGSDPYTPAYARQDVPLGMAAKELFFGDGDNDGRAELYATDEPDRVQQVRFVAGAWQKNLVGTFTGAASQILVGRVVVGDGDGDGRREVYAAALDYAQRVGRVVQFSYGPAAPQPAFDATFSGASGNGWWVQVNVVANQPLYSVEARINCAVESKPLAKQSWGGWAASFQVPSGAKVTFRATAIGGATDASGGYIWPNATPAAGC